MLALRSVSSRSVRCAVFAMIEPRFSGAKKRGRRDSGVHLREAVHGGAVAAHRTEQLLPFGRRRREHCDVAGELVHRKCVLIARALVIRHRVVERAGARKGQL